MNRQAKGEMGMGRKTLRVGFDPREYRLIKTVWENWQSHDCIPNTRDLKPEWVALLASCVDEGNRCALCGQQTGTTIAVIEHLTTGVRYALGGTCREAMNASTPEQVVADRVSRNEGARTQRRVNDERRVAWNAAHPDEARVLDEAEALIAQQRGHEVSPIIHGAIRNRRNYGAPTDKQTAAIIQSAAWHREAREREEAKQQGAAQREADRAAADAARVERAAKAWPAESGREEIVGTVVVVKEQEVWDGGNRVTHLKMVVELEDGRRLYGTLPVALQRLADGNYRDWREVKGMRVAFTAEVSRSDRDPGFGFYRRPVKVRMIGEGAK